MRRWGAALELHGFTELFRTGLEHPLCEVVVHCADFLMAEELLNVCLVEAGKLGAVQQSLREQLIGVEAAANGFLQCTNHHHYVVLVLWSNFSSQEGGEVLLPMVIYRLGKSESSDRIAKPIH